MIRMNFEDKSVHVEVGRCGADLYFVDILWPFYHTVGSIIILSNLAALIVYPQLLTPEIDLTGFPFDEHFENLRYWYYGNGDYDIA